jgi:hypothetical protein
MRNGTGESAIRPTAVWPESLGGLGAIRLTRYYYHFKNAVRFYRDLVGLPVYETFEGSYGSDGVIFGMPGASLSFEIVMADGPVAVDSHEQICLYFPDADARERATARFREAGIEPVESQPCWAATGAVTYRDPDGRELVFAPFIYGKNEPDASIAEGKHGYPPASSA